MTAGLVVLAAFAAGCGSNDSPNTSGAPTGGTAAAPTGGTAGAPTSGTGGAPTGGTAAVTVAPAPSATSPTTTTRSAAPATALYRLYVNAYDTLNAVAADPAGSPDDPRLARVDTGPYLSSVQGVIAQLRSQGLVTKVTETHLSGFKVLQPGPGGSWVANICNANNGDNFNAKTGARVTHTGYAAVLQQFLAVPGPAGTWKISRLATRPGSC